MRIELRQLLLLAVLLGFLGGAWYLGFRRLGQQREFYVADIQRKEQALSGLTTAAATVQQLDRQLAELEETLQFFEQRIPRRQEVDSILDQIWKLAEANGLTTRSVRPLKPGRNGACIEQPMEVAFAGRYAGFYQFLTQLEGLQRITRVTKAELKRPVDPDADPDMLNIKLELNVYYEPESAVAETR
jgi:type IV pilus assembly protein PilO